MGASGVDFNILGPLHASAAGRPLSIGGPREQKILAILLVNANLVVSVDQLVDAVWDTDPPSTSRNQIRNRISQLRKNCASAEPDAGDVITTEGSGYRIRVRATDLDATRFEDSVTAANTALQSGDSAEAAWLMRKGLAQWRGPALSGIDGLAARTAADQLDNRRLTVLEDCFACELGLGWHNQILDELTKLTAEHPFRERLILYLMNALLRSGRRAEALAVYRGTVTLFRDELGIDPGAELRLLHEEVLRGEAFHVDGKSTVDTPPLPQPAELPADIVDFTGRDADLRRLDQALPDNATTGVPILAITGGAGVGKTAFALHWAHRAKRHFPDGQMFLDLRGHTPTPPLTPQSALGSLLRSLGVPTDQLPEDVDTASRMFRSLVSDRRMLLLLDNVAAADQVRLLLPGGAGCLVVLTSRDNLAGLSASHGAHLVPLEVLGNVEAVALLAKVVGGDAVAADPQATTELARSCAYLPLALRIAAANVASRTHRTIRDYLNDLQLSDRLAALRIAGDSPAVRTAFDTSYTVVPTKAQRLFRFIGLVPGSDVSVPAAAALSGLRHYQVRTLLTELTRAHLIREHSPGRYTFHDLLRLYAQKLCATEDSDEDRQQAWAALASWYLDRTAAAAHQLHPHMLRLGQPQAVPGEPPIDNPQAAAAWLDAEYDNLIAAGFHAVEHGPTHVTWHLADALRGYFWLRGHKSDWLALGQAALRAALDHNEPHTQVVAHISMGFAHQSQGRYSTAAKEYSKALAPSQRAAWREGEAAARVNVGLVLLHTGNLKQAAPHLLLALTIYRRLGHTLGQANTLRTLGHLRRHQGHLHAAVQCISEALVLYRTSNSASGEALARLDLGVALRVLGLLDVALVHDRVALSIYRELGDHDGRASTLDELAIIDHERGDHQAALQHAMEALDIAQRADLRQITATIHNTLGVIHNAMANPCEAVNQHERVIALANEVEPRCPVLLDAQLGLAAARRNLGQHRAATGHALAAFRQARQHGYRLSQNAALHELAAAVCVQSTSASLAGQP
jgi:DNA-binding SARP family transcriptional activator/tetratricopeptide (TPR) repeat protein